MLKYYLISFCVLIMLALLGAGFFLVKDSKQRTHTHAQQTNLADTASTGSNKRMAWALTVRIGLSVLLFASVWLFYWLGWIKPTGLPY